MIFLTLSSSQKKKLNRLIYALGIIALITGFIPGWLSFQWGLVLFIFSLVLAGIVKIIIPDPENPEKAPASISHVEQVLKKADDVSVEPEKPI